MGRKIAAYDELLKAKNKQGGMGLRPLEIFVNAYKFLAPLFISGFFFLLSFYFCMLGVSLFIYSLPFYALFLLISLFLFYQADQKINRYLSVSKQTFSQYRFYHRCIGIYLILSIVLFGASVAYIPFYNNGGFVFVWYCAPMSILCLISLIQSRKRMIRLKKELLKQRLNITSHHLFPINQFEK